MKGREGGVVVMGGGGSGKRGVVMDGIGYLMGEKDVGGWNILGITFRNKGGREMGEGVEGILGGGGDEIWMCTLERMCVGILGGDIEGIGVNGKFCILERCDEL
ncbi:UvrD-helicase domain-containing protein [Bacillus altitudinis]|uniref:UvrD-helicase domain-containing protein n=1 Tax=Bacillus altitudinis TaxID=293387 RepID=UPI003B5257C7